MIAPPISPLDSMIYLNAKNQIDFISSSCNTLNVIESEKELPLLLITNDPKNKPLIPRLDLESSEDEIEWIEKPYEKRITRAFSKCLEIAAQPTTSKRILKENTNIIRTKKRVRFNEELSVNDGEDKENVKMSKVSEYD
jgi:hypothetical protein